MTNLLLLIELLPYRAFSLETIMFLCTIVLLVLAVAGFLMLYKTKVPDKIDKRTLTGMAVVLISMSTAIFTCFIYNYFYARPQTCSQHDLKMEKQDCLPPLDSMAKIMEEEYENNLKKRKEIDKTKECPQNSDSLNNERDNERINERVKKRENEKEKEIKEEIIEMNSLRRSEQSEHLEIPEYSKFSNEPDLKIAP